jgi:hypothetical protein
MRLGYYDNAERRARWQDILKDYDPAGFRVEIVYPIQATGTIIRQMTIGGEAQVATQPGAFFLVDLDESYNWQDYADNILHGDPQKMHDVYRQLEQFDCLTETGDIERLFVQWPDLEAIDIKRGQPLEYVERESGRGIPGTKTTLGIATKDVYQNPKNNHRIVDFFLLEPLSWYRAPIAIETDFIKPEYLSSFSFGLTVEGAYRDWKNTSPETLPPGRLTEDGNEYLFDHPIPLSEVKRVCDAVPRLEKEDKLRCMLEGSTFHIVPIDQYLTAGVFRPMRVEHAGWVTPFVVTKRDLEDLARGAEGEPDEDEPDEDGPDEWGREA